MVADARQGRPSSARGLAMSALWRKGRLVARPAAGRSCAKAKREVLEVRTCWRCATTSERRSGPLCARRTPACGASSSSFRPERARPSSPPPSRRRRAGACSCSSTATSSCGRASRSSAGCGREKRSGLSRPSATSTTVAWSWRPSRRSRTRAASTGSTRAPSPWSSPTKRITSRRTRGFTSWKDSTFCRRPCPAACSWVSRRRPRAPTAWASVTCSRRSSTESPS